MESAAGGQLSSAQKDELMDQVKQQIAIATAQELLTKMTEKCFRKCVTRPGTSLDSSEQRVKRPLKENKPSWLGMINLKEKARRNQQGPYHSEESPIVR